MEYEWRPEACSVSMAVVGSVGLVVFISTIFAALLRRGLLYPQLREYRRESHKTD